MAEPNAIHLSTNNKPGVNNVGYGAYLSENKEDDRLKKLLNPAHPGSISAMLSSGNVNGNSIA